MGGRCGGDTGIIHRTSRIMVPVWERDPRYRIFQKPSEEEEKEDSEQEKTYCGALKTSTCSWRGGGAE